MSSTSPEPAASGQPGNPPDTRLTGLLSWIATLSTFSLQPDSLRPASADASFRRYFRIADQQGQTYVLMDAPPAQEPVEPFIRIGALLSGCGVTVPQVLASDVEQGYLLLSDLGTVMYSHLLNQDTAQKLYMDAIDSLLRIQTLTAFETLPAVDRAWQLKELQIFPEWYVARHLGAELTPARQTLIDQVFNQILANTNAQAQVVMHRDYHSRNLMVMQEGNPGVLDFQGAMVGPVTYDLVSLLRDAYIEWDEEQVLDWAIRYWEQARQIGLPVPTDIDSFYRDFEYMGLQRHLKILGIFCRLAYRDGKTTYLDDLPLVLAYVRKTARRYRELAPLIKLLDDLEQQAPQVGYTF